MAPDARRSIGIVRDGESGARRSPEVDHERAVALFDLIEDNDFALVGGKAGPYRLRIGIFEQRLVFVLAVQLDQPCGEFAESRGGRECPTYECSASALARQLAPDNGFLAFVLENRLDDGVRFAGAHQIC